MKTNIMHSQWRIISAVLILITCFFAIVPPVQASDIDNTGIVKADEVINDDLLLSAETVQMDGTVNGLLLATGNMVIINGKVVGDLIAFGSSVTVTDTAEIQGNVFAGAQNITINGKVAGSVFGGSATLINGPQSSIGFNEYYGGYSLTQSAGSVIGKDLRAAVYQAILEGETGQDAIIYGEAVEVSSSGRITRNAEFLVGTPGSQSAGMPPFMGNMGVTRNLQPGLRVNPAAVIGGVMTYTSKVNQSSSIAATPMGGIVYKTPVPEVKEEKSEMEKPVSGVFGTFANITGFIGKLIALLLLGALIIWKTPALLDENIETLKSKPWPAFGYGFVTIIVGIAAIIISLMLVILLAIIIGFITVGDLTSIAIGLGVSVWGTAMAVFNLAVYYISKIIVSTLVGRWIFSKLAPQNTNAFWPMVIGVLVYAILDTIPVLNFLLEFVVIILGVGAIWLVFRAKTTKQSDQATINA